MAKVKKQSKKRKPQKEIEAKPKPKKVVFEKPTKLDNAKRILSYGKYRAKWLLLTAKTMGCWSHVDWEYVQKALKRR